MSFTVRELLVGRGSPYGAWFEALDALAAAKVVTAIARMEHGNLSNVRWFKGIGEYRIDWGPGYRLYLARDGVSTLLLLGGGTKRTQWRDIEQALLRWGAYKQRKALG